MKKENRWLLWVLGSALLGCWVGAPLERLYAAPASEKQVSQALVNINKADADELESIKGVGPMLAGRILEFREAKGSFKQLEDLIQVPGIGQAKFEKIKSQLTL